MKKVYWISAIIVFLGISSGIGYFMYRDATASIPDTAELETIHKEPYVFGEKKNKLKLIEFMYTHCPDICPTTTQKMNLLKRDLIEAGVYGKEIEFISITIDPFRDTHEDLARYMETFDIEDDGNWVFLTGDKDEIKTVADSFLFQYRDPGDGFYVHTTFTYLVDEENEYIKKFPMGEDFNKKEVFDKIMDSL